MKRKKIELDSELEIWKSYMGKAEEVLFEFDKVVKDHQKQENRQMKWLIAIYVIATTSKYK